MECISSDDLELYCLGRITAERELAPIEEHLLVCHSCIERAETTQREVDAIRYVLEVGEEMRSAGAGPR
jgi:hypothetical protein